MNIKNIILLVLIVIVARPAFASFTDVNKNTQYHDAILYSQKNNIVNGYEDGEFRPQNTINRAEFTKIIINATHSEEEITGENCFEDVAGQWFAKYICTAKNKGIVNGYEGGKFKPTATISYVEAAKIITLGFGAKTKKIANKGEEGEWYKSYVSYIEENNARPETVKVLTQELTRGEMVEMIWQIKTSKKLKTPEGDSIYFGAFPDFGGTEDQVTAEKIEKFENLIGKKIFWAYFSQNWYDGIEFPQDAIDEIEKTDAIPFVRLLPRSADERFYTEQKFALEKITNGDFDADLKQWAMMAKQYEKPLLVDFAVEPNGNWFPWSGVLNTPDGPQKYREAYRHIIDIFKEENVTNITWFFHADINSLPDEEWNQPKYYYPGDDYIDWIGFSIYGPQNTGEEYWDKFSEILAERHASITEISPTKPIAVLEFGVTDDNPYGNKAEWYNDAFKTILDNEYMKISAISAWNESWEEEDGSMANISIDSSQESLEAFKNGVSNVRFVSELASKIWQPKPRTTWQWQLGGDLNGSYDVEVYDIDLFNTTDEEITKLHNKNRKVICYFNAGAYEPYRLDSSKFSEESLGKIMQGWEDEKWLDIANYAEFEKIMQSRFDLAVTKKCDAIEPDNIDGYTNDTGFDLTYKNQLTYNKWLANEAHKRGLAIGLKNDLDQISDLEPVFDFAINEQCFQYNECEKLTQFTQNNKAVFGVEYEKEKSEFCEKAKEMQFSWLKMDYDLNGKRNACE